MFKQDLPIKKVKHHNHIEQLIIDFDHQLEKYCDQKEEQLRQSVEAIANQIQHLIHKYKLAQIPP